MIKATIRLLKAMPSNIRETAMTSVCGLAAGLVVVGFLVYNKWVCRVTLVALSQHSWPIMVFG